MKRFALTGGIASGKSKVAALLKDAGIPVVDADQLSRIVVQKGSAGLQAVVDCFGTSILTADGNLDRAKMGTVVFNDPTKRQQLEQILHPRIAQAGVAALQALEEAGHRHAIYEAALIFENALENAFDATILVTTTPELQSQRLQSRDGLDKDAAQKRMAAQMPLHEKEKRTSFIIKNTGTLQELQYEVVNLWQNLTGERLAWAQ